MERSSLCQYLKFTAGICTGVVVAWCVKVGGPSSELHERCHALAFRLLTTCKPRVEVAAWGSWKEAFQKPGFGSKLWAGIEILSGESPRAFCDGGPGYYNAWGMMLGPDVSRVIIWGAGAASAIPVHATAMICGVRMNQRKGAPYWAAALLGFGLFGHFLESYYPITAALESVGELGDLVKKGHDFALVAESLGKIWDSPPHRVAKRVAWGWSLSVPLIGLGSRYLLPLPADSHENAPQ